MVAEDWPAVKNGKRDELWKHEIEIENYGI